MKSNSLPNSSIRHTMSNPLKSSSFKHINSLTNSQHYISTSITIYNIKPITIILILLYTLITITNGQDPTIQPTGTPKNDPTSFPTVQPTAFLCCQCTDATDTPGCFDDEGDPLTECEDIICANEKPGDPVCCDIEWDQQCASYAKTICDENRPNTCCLCTVPHPGEPGCEYDLECEQAVCASDPPCCGIVGWDQTCANLAETFCQEGTPSRPPTISPTAPTQPTAPTEPTTGAPTISPIPTISPTRRPTRDPFNTDIGPTVSPSLPSSAPIPQGLCCSCTNAQLTSGCHTDQECEDLICDATNDPFCCQSEWDITCAATATDICNNATPSPTTPTTPTTVSPSPAGSHPTPEMPTSSPTNKLTSN
eukprot:248816_1